ncbi:MAG: VWA domain-containing protein, partial [Clostridia bacterium]|nr:VWA domain-containing protein [Clostridia bacterium]
MRQLNKMKTYGGRDSMTAVVLSILSILVALVVFFSTIFPAITATEGSGAFDPVTTGFFRSGYDWTAVSDGDTSDIENGFSLIVDEDGKVSVDKSVVYGADHYGAYQSYSDYEFSVVLSTIAQEYNLYNKMTVDIPLDVVFILDTSGSMKQRASDNQNSNNPNDISKARAMTDALNAAMKYLMDDNPNNRIGVVTYSDGAAPLIALDHYTTTNANGDFFAYSHVYTGSGNSRSMQSCTIQTVTGGIKNSSGQTVTASTDSQNANQVANWIGTYTQGGIARAAEMFCAVQDTTVTDLSGNVIKRKPVMIMLSDGEPTYCNPLYDQVLDANGNFTTIYGNGVSQLHSSGEQNNKAVLGYYTILSANYYKNQVANHYKRTSNFYTIGEGTGATGTGTINTAISITGDEYRRAVLEPNAERVAELLSYSYTYHNITAEMLYQLLNSSYTGQTVQIRPGSEHGSTYSNNIINTNSTAYIVPVTQPNPYTSYDYANGSYFGYLSSTELQQVFTRIVIESKETVEYGFALKQNTAVTFSDTLGDGMYVPEAPVLHYNGANYLATSYYDTEDANTRTATYVYDYQLSNVVMSLNRDVDLADILVQVTTDKATGTQTVTMAVPEACVPIISHDDDGNWEVQLPLRLLYKVKPTDSAIDAAEEARASDPDAVITFYTNAWDGATATVGASAEIFPSWNNPYYDDLDNYVEDEVAKDENTSGTYNYVKVSETGLDPDADPAHPSKHSVITIGNNGVLTIGEV